MALVRLFQRAVPRGPRDREIAMRRAVIKYRVAVDEKERLALVADRLGTSLSGYVRHAAQIAAAEIASPGAYHADMAAVRRWSNELGGLAKRPDLPKDVRAIVMEAALSLKAIASRRVGAAA